MSGIQPGNEETYLEDRIDLTIEPRERAFSQENIGRNDQSELIETRTLMGGQLNGAGYALSQYYHCPQSQFNDETMANGLGGDITESEPDEDPITYQHKQKVRNLLSQVKPTVSLFKRYYEWFN